MFDNFMFSNGQDLAALASSGIKSTDWWNLEEGVAADQQILGWINGIILASNNTGAAEGLSIMLRSSDSTDLDTTPFYCGGTRLTKAEIATGHRFSFGVYKSKLKKYTGIWYNAFQNSLNGATTVDCWFSEQPVAILGIQKMNASAGAT